MGAKWSRTLALLSAKENLTLFDMEFPNAKHTIDKINTMQQTIIMYECMNRKNDEF
jgi:hypothetical protein